MNNNFKFESILVPYNGTEGAKQGLKSAVELAKKIDAQIILIACIENQSGLSFFRKNNDEKFEEEKKLVETELQKIESDIQGLAKPIKHDILKSSFAPDSIVEYVEKNNVDMVIIGQTKIKHVEQKYHQSMANYLLQGLTCPLLIVK